MIKLKTKEEIEILREGGRRLARVLDEVKKAVKPGVKTQELEDLARELIAEQGARPAFLGYKPAGSRQAYPAALCVSVNNEIVHGIPSNRELEEGDVVSLDSGLIYEGLYTDMAITVPVGQVSPQIEKMIKTVEDALEAGIFVAGPGKKVGDISVEIEKVIKGAGFKVVKELCGHGVGYAPHEDPFVPNYGKAGTGPDLVPGLVIAIEPMLTTGSGEIEGLPDGFTFVTRDGKLSTHAEKTIVITETGAEVLTKLN